MNVQNSLGPDPAPLPAIDRQAGRTGLRKFLRYVWGMIVRPRPTLSRLAAEPSIRWGLLAACLGPLQVWGNMLLHLLTGQDWLGTRPYLPEPTFVFAFGQVQVGLEHWVPVFAVLAPVLAFWSLMFTCGAAHTLSKLWKGQGTFEATINTLAFAFAVPGLLIGAGSKWLLSIPMNLISGHPYWWNAAMLGEFGPAVALVWNIYVMGVYIGLQWVWILVLGTLAIRQVQKIPAWAAALTMLLAFALNMLMWSVFTR